jgi:hypothetical protein
LTGRARGRIRKGGISERYAETIPQIILHNSYTGKNLLFLHLYINDLLESKDWERVIGTDSARTGHTLAA